MSVIIDGTSGVSTPNTFAFKNRLIDAGFIINQRAYTSGTALSAGSYGHDRWKAGSGGTPLRGNYAGIGYTYDAKNDVFYGPQPYPSWILNKDTWSWKPPIPKPETPCKWDEATKTWIEL